MGKSTGKWIKTVLFGKKSAKSRISKNSVTEKEEINTSSGDQEENPSVVSDQASHISDKNGENLQLETGVSVNLPHNAIVSLPGTQDANREGNLVLDSQDNVEIDLQEQAAIKAQAAFRGYLARRAFNALKGIIMLQAVIRGDLVRRQTSANLLYKQGQKDSSQTELVLEQPQNEIEKVRRKLRKVSRSRREAPEKSETATLRQKPSLRKVSRSSVADAPQKGVHSPSEETRGAVPSVLKDSKQPEIQVDVLDGDHLVVELPQENCHEVEKAPLVDKELNSAEETIDVLDDDHLGVELHPRENCHEVEKAPLADEGMNSREAQTYKENQRTRRRKSFPVNQECEENASLSYPTLPSYMAATASAKAKLRIEGSPRFGKDSFENGFYKRHSLPSSATGRLSSMSSQMQKEVQENGKGGNKNVKSQLSSSNGHEKVAKAGWRR